MAVLLFLREGARLYDDEIKISFSRSGGPGGQNVNKLNTKATLKIYPDSCRSISDMQKKRIHTKLSHKITVEGCIVVESSRHRTREMNRRDALEKLAVLLNDALKRDKRRRKTRVPKGVREKRLVRKKRRGELKRNRGPVDTNHN